MASINKVILIGNLGRDPETRYLPNGDAVTQITIATTESWKDKHTGEKKETTEWHRITFYRKLAEIVQQYLKKGASLYVEGRLQTRKWTDKEGIERYTTEIIADSMQMLGGKSNGGTSGPVGSGAGSGSGSWNGSGGSGASHGSASDYARQSGRSARQPASSGGPHADMDDDIPFAPLPRHTLLSL